MKSNSHHIQVILSVLIIFLLLIPPLIYFSIQPIRHYLDEASLYHSRNLQAIASLSTSELDSARLHAAALDLAKKETELSRRSFRKAQTSTFIRILIGGLCTALFTTFLLMRRLIGPLISLCNQIENIATDPANGVKIKVKGGAEFQEISKAFNRHMELLKEKDRQLLQAQQMELTGLLAGGIVHEFNTVLTSVRGFAEYLQKNLPPDDFFRKITGQIVTAVNRGSHLTRALRPFQREGLIQPEPVDMNLLVQEVQKEHGKLIGDSIAIQTEPFHRPLWVMGDRHYLKQVLINVINNARDAMPDGGLLRIVNEIQKVNEVFLYAYDWVSPGEFAGISITDAGIGIDEKTVGRIFQAFFTTKGIGQGPGLGLTMAYGIIREHKGYLSVRSEPEQGTTVTIYLPILDPACHMS